jgi:uncharacterized membrane protein
LLEGLEVWLVVATLGLKGRLSSAGAAVAVAFAGMLVRAPLQQVPENAIKFVVGTMILVFGTFWA